MKWIKCSERLPEQDKDVLIWNGERSLLARLGTLNKDGSPPIYWFIHSEGDEYSNWCQESCYDLSNFTHWMPLPEGPKDDI